MRERDEGEERVVTAEEVAALLVRAQELASRDELTAQELKEFVYALYDSTDPDGEPILYCGTLTLPDRENPRLSLYADEPGNNSVFVTTLDGIIPEPTLGSGDIVRLGGENGEPVWRAGLDRTFYSEFLGRREEIDLTNQEPWVMSVRPLTPQEHAKVAKALWGVWPDKPTGTIAPSGIA